MARRSTALAAALLAVAAIAAPSAVADSIVFERGGDVWLANPDGSGQRQVTTDGGYSNPSQADDGTIAAVKDGLLHRLDRAGRLLNLAGDPSGSGPLIASSAPGGGLIAYHYDNTGSVTPGPRTALSHADRQTGNDEIFNIGGWINPSWIGDGTVLMFDGSQTFAGDTLLHSVGQSGTRPWFEDEDLSLTGGEVDTGVTRLAATDGNVIRLYRLTGPPPALPEAKCVVSEGEGAYFRPTWSPDGSQLAWQQGRGVYVAPVNLDDCAASRSTLALPGGRAPDWGPAAAGPPLAATAPSRVRLRALVNSGLRVRVNCSCRVAARLLLGGRAIGGMRRTVSGSALVRVKPNRKGRARLLRGGKRVSVRVTGAGARVTRRVRVVRATD